MRKPITMPGRTECESASPSSDVPRTTRKQPTRPRATDTSMPCTTMGQYVSRPYVQPGGGELPHQTQGLMMACQSAFMSYLPLPFRGERAGVRGETFYRLNRSTVDALTPHPRPLPSAGRGSRSEFHVLEVSHWLVADLRVNAVRRRVALVGEQRAVLAARRE